MRKLAILSIVLLFLAVAALSTMVAIWGKPNISETNVEVTVIDWPGYGPVMQITYCIHRGAALFVREWIPADPQQKMQVDLRRLEMKWGSGWLMPMGRGMVAVWMDMTALWSSVYMPYRYFIVRDVPLTPDETDVAVGPLQILDFAPGAAAPEEQNAPPVVEIPVNAQGVQEVVLVVSRDGYNPVRFAVKKGVPVRLTFRQLGRVGCGEEMHFPIAPDDYVTLSLESEADKEVLEFTPPVAGEFPFFCPYTKYGGMLIVRE